MFEKYESIILKNVMTINQFAKNMDLSTIFILSSIQYVMVNKILKQNKKATDAHIICHIQFTGQYYEYI